MSAVNFGCAGAAGNGNWELGKGLVGEGERGKGKRGSKLEGTAVGTKDRSTTFLATSYSGSYVLRKVKDGNIVK